MNIITSFTVQDTGGSHEIQYELAVCFEKKCIPKLIFKGQGWGLEVGWGSRGWEWGGGVGVGVGGGMAMLTLPLPLHV
jgi:hypothetical protein